MLAINYLLRVAIVIGFFGASCKNGNIDSEDENAPKMDGYGAGTADRRRKMIFC